jgi:hypothetical protein
MKRVLLLLGLCLSIAAPYSVAVGQKVDTMKTIERDIAQKDVVLSAAVPQKTAAGAPVHLKLSVQNRSKGDVEFVARMKYWDYGLQLLDGKGQPVGLTRFGKVVENARRGGSSVMLKLAAGKGMEDTLNLARIFDLTMEGEYTLSVSRELEGINLKIEGMKFQVVGEP